MLWPTRLAHEMGRLERNILSQNSHVIAASAFTFCPVSENSDDPFLPPSVISYSYPRARQSNGDFSGVRSVHGRRCPPNFWWRARPFTFRKYNKQKSVNSFHCLRKT
ncbi:hypothetical protein EVAR_33539_1 [Eumeta japonica]|uniref:Uncharacterized protein n=1 Tax=Eumeta variegata TaxID=151549 RepID=A0A4C1VJN1_EUMVA|nr:hypothetical protein EVAR_33539_1 [Eumeta japonica]